MLIANEINFLLIRGLLLSDDMFNIQNTDTCFNKPLKLLYWLNYFLWTSTKKHIASFKMLWHS